MQNTSSQTYVVKKENDEAMIVTHHSQGNQNNSMGSVKHRRSHNIQTVLEDISNSSVMNRKHDTRPGSKNSTKTNYSKRVSSGKENRSDLASIKSGK